MANNKKAVQGSEFALDQLKAEVAQELGVTVGADQSARNNGAVGGAMVRKLIQIAEASMAQK